MCIRKNVALLKKKKKTERKINLMLTYEIKKKQDASQGLISQQKNVHDY